MKEKKLPKVGLGVIILKDNKVLLGQRINAHGEGTWCPPGGHLEFNEELEECAKRETMEETGIEIKNLRIGPVTNDVFKKEGKHYLTIFMVSEHARGDATVKEPHRFKKWEWHDWDKMPKPLFLPVENLLKQNYFPFKR